MSGPTTEKGTWRWWGLLGIVAAVALPFVIHALYGALSSPPERVRIATGPEGGRYRVLAEALAHELETRLGVESELIHTEGTVDNLELLGRGAVDFGLYQQGTTEAGALDEPPNVQFVARLYDEVVHLIVRRAADIDSIRDLEGQRVSIGPLGSGDSVMGRVVLSHFGLDDGSVDYLNVDYDDLPEAFADDELDAAVVATGLRAPVLDALFSTDRDLRLLPIPQREALAVEHLFLSATSIPPGVYSGDGTSVPAERIPTVTTAAQLLTHVEVSSLLVEEAARALHDERFLRRYRLRELFADGTGYSRRKGDFPVHRGAVAFYEPELRPLLDPDFVEATEGIRSFVVSLGIALFFLLRWLRERRDRREDHQLDGYIRSLLEIERRQMALDSGTGDRDDEIAQLQELLSDVTRLRQEALREFTMHQLNENSGVDCFIEMCHALSNKINAKLTRQRFDRAIEIGGWPGAKPPADPR